VQLPKFEITLNSDAVTKPISAEISIVIIFLN